MSIETGVVLDYNWEPIFWHLPPGRSSGYLPDSRDLWSVIWENRDQVAAVAHSHPEGIINPSGTDITTFAAIEAGLGKLLLWPIVTGSEVAIYRRYSKTDNNYNKIFYMNEILWKYDNLFFDSWVEELISKSRFESDYMRTGE